METVVRSHNEMYIYMIPIPADMKKFILVLCLLLFVAGCKDNTITGKVITDVNVDTVTTDSTREEVKPATEQVPREDPEESRAHEYDDVTDVKTYSVKGECTEDSKGVVRFFDDEGKKTVYRDECDFGFIVTYSCDGNKVASKSIPCSGECVRGVYGDECR